MEQALAEKKSEAGKQKEKKPLESGAVRAVVEIDSSSPRAVHHSVCKLRQYKALPIHFPMALGFLNSYYTTTSNL